MGVLQLIDSWMEDRSLLNFVRHNKRDFVEEWFHVEIALTLQKFAHDAAMGLNPRQIITMPPRHGKSMLTSVYFPVWAVLNNPALECIVASYSLNLAKRHTTEGLELYQNQDDFPQRLSKHTTGKGNWRTNKGGGVYAAGLGGSITGFGADLFIIDDYVKGFDDALSPTQRDKVWRWYHAVATTRLSPNSGILVMATRWHSDDLIGRLIEDGGFNIIDYPAIATQDEPHRSKGEALSSRYPLEVLDKKRRANQVVFECLYQCNPAPSDAAIWPEKYIKRFNLKDAPTFNYYMTSADLTFGGDGSSNNVIAVYGINKDGAWLVEKKRGKWSIGESVRIIEQFAIDYPTAKGDNCLVELKAGGSAAVEQLSFECKTFSPSSSKVVRASAVSGMVENGMLHIPFEEPEFFKEIKEFPHSKFDDCVDVTSMILTELSGRNFATKRWEIDEDALRTSTSWHNSCLSIIECWAIDLPTAVVVVGAVTDKGIIIIDALRINATSISDVVDKYHAQASWARTQAKLERFHVASNKHIIVNELRRQKIEVKSTSKGLEERADLGWMAWNVSFLKARHNVKSLIADILAQEPEPAKLGSSIRAFLTLLGVYSRWLQQSTQNG